MRFYELELTTDYLLEKEQENKRSLRFDVHAMVSQDKAIPLETQLHQRLSEKQSKSRQRTP